MKDGISICITAWQTENFIEDTLDSIMEQTWIKENSNYEILVGVDYCPNTLQKLREIKSKYKNLKIFLSDKHVGTYILSNSLMNIAKYDWVLRFDSDDIMEPNMLEELMNNRDGHDIINYKTKNFQNNSNIFSTPSIAEGSICIKKDIFIKFGGYRPWECGADTELRKRISKFINIKKIDKSLYLRRIHNNNLTVRKETYIDSDLRNSYKKFIDSNTYKKENDAYIKLTITKLIAITGNELNQPIIVSFTTWKERLSTIDIMIGSLINQTKKPDKVLCWLSSDEFDGENIPSELKKYIDDKIIEIKWVDKNTKGYKKYEVFKEYHNAFVILMDDDINYNKNYIEILYKYMIRYPYLTVSYYGATMDLYSTNRLYIPLLDEPNLKTTYYSGVSAWPPYTFPLEVFEHEEFKNSICSTNDDLWINGIAIKNNIKKYAYIDIQLEKWKDINDRVNCLWNINKEKVDNIMLIMLVASKIFEYLNIKDKVMELWPNYDINKCIETYDLNFKDGERIDNPALLSDETENTSETKNIVEEEPVKKIYNVANIILKEPEFKENTRVIEGCIWSPIK